MKNLFDIGVEILAGIYVDGPQKSFTDSKPERMGNAENIGEFPSISPLLATDGG